jgi:hypothetical protein
MSDDFHSEHGRRKHGKHDDEHGYGGRRYYDEHDRDRDDEHDHEYSYGHGHGLGDLHRMKYLAEKILRNKTLLVVLLIAVVIVLILAIWLVILFLPLIGKVLNFIMKNGLAGVYDYLLKILNGLLKGTGG